MSQLSHFHKDTSSTSATATQMRVDGIKRQAEESEAVVNRRILNILKRMTNYQQPAASTSSETHSSSSGAKPDKRSSSSSARNKPTAAPHQSGHPGPPAAKRPAVCAPPASQVAPAPTVTSAVTSVMMMMTTASSGSTSIGGVPTATTTKVIHLPIRAVTMSSSGVVPNTVHSVTTAGSPIAAATATAAAAATAISDNSTSLPSGSSATDSDLVSGNTGGEATATAAAVGGGSTSRRCACQRSNCLKLYCECFAAGLFCFTDCVCMDCKNTEQHNDRRTQAVQRIVDRRPNAFDSKIGYASGNAGMHVRGCKCKRSGCLKNYCECYEARIPCTSLCRCHQCCNTDASQRAAQSDTGTAVVGVRTATGETAEALARMASTNSTSILLPTTGSPPTTGRAAVTLSAATTTTTSSSTYSSSSSSSSSSSCSTPSSWSHSPKSSPRLASTTLASSTPAAVGVNVGQVAAAAIAAAERLDPSLASLIANNVGSVTTAGVNNNTISINNNGGGGLRVECVKAVPPDGQQRSLPTTIGTAVSKPTTVLLLPPSSPIWQAVSLAQQQKQHHHQQQQLHHYHQQQQQHIYHQQQEHQQHSILANSILVPGLQTAPVAPPAAVPTPQPPTASDPAAASATLPAPALDLLPDLLQNSLTSNLLNTLLALNGCYNPLSTAAAVAAAVAGLTSSSAVSSTTAPAPAVTAPVTCSSLLLPPPPLAPGTSVHLNKTQTQSCNTLTLESLFGGGGGAMVTAVNPLSLVTNPMMSSGSPALLGTAATPSSAGLQVSNLLGPLLSAALGQAPTPAPPPPAPTSQPQWSFPLTIAGLLKALEIGGGPVTMPDVPVGFGGGDTRPPVSDGGDSCQGLGDPTRVKSEPSVEEKASGDAKLEDYPPPVLSINECFTTANNELEKPVPVTANWLRLSKQVDRLTRLVLCQRRQLRRLQRQQRRILASRRGRSALAPYLTPVRSCRHSD